MDNHEERPAEKSERSERTYLMFWLTVFGFMTAAWAAFLIWLIFAYLV
jgi:hypothetical protein